MVFRARHKLPRSCRASRGGRGFTMMEMMIVLTIMSIVAVLGMDSMNGFEEANRPERAARECLAFLRYARHMAMVTGSPVKVQLDTTNQNFAVYMTTDGVNYSTTPMTQAMASGGTMLITIPTNSTIAGVTMSATATTFAYGPLGTCGATGTITFTFGTRSKTLTVPAVGDPQFN